MKRVLITGASGLLGSNTAAEFLKRGYQVRVLIRRSSRTTALGGLEVEKVYGDLADTESVQKAVRGCQYVVHAAANTRQWGIAAIDYQRDNVESVNKITQAALRYGIERLIFVSTANVFQPGDKTRPGDETTTAAPALSDTYYISSKLAAENLIQAKVRQEGLPAIIVNPTFLIGPRDAQPSSGRLLLHGLRHRVVLCPAGGKNFIDVRDAACGIANAITQGRIGRRYLLAHENLSYADFFNQVAFATGLHRPRLLMPARLLQSAARASEIWGKLSGHPLPLTATGAHLLNSECYYTADKAIRELGLPQTPIKNAIEAALDWFALFGYWQPDMHSPYSPLITIRP